MDGQVNWKKLFGNIVSNSRETINFKDFEASEIQEPLHTILAKGISKGKGFKINLKIKALKMFILSKK